MVYICGEQNKKNPIQKDIKLLIFLILNKDPKKFGVQVLDDSAKETFENLAEMLSKYGFFIVEVGELEGWLKKFGISSGNKNVWLIEIFQRLGADPDDDSYVK